MYPAVPCLGLVQTDQSKHFGSSAPVVEIGCVEPRTDPGRRPAWIRGGLVFDSDPAAFAARDIALAGDRISRVAGASESQAGDDQEAWTDPSILDARDLYLLPGLIDCHVHLVMRGDDADPSANARRSEEEVSPKHSRRRPGRFMAGRPPSGTSEGGTTSRCRLEIR